MSSGSAFMASELGMRRLEVVPPCQSIDLKTGELEGGSGVTWLYCAVLLVA